MTALIQPLPWTADCSGGGGRVYDDNGFLVIRDLTADEANFIVRACNNHAAMLAALKALVAAYEDPQLDDPHALVVTAKDAIDNAEAH